MGSPRPGRARRRIPRYPGILFPRSGNRPAGALATETFNERTPRAKAGETEAGTEAFNAWVPRARASEARSRYGESVPGASGFRLEDYEFAYPRSLIATAPATPRDAARMLVLDRTTGRIEHRRFLDLPQYLRPGDCLVLNRSKVLPARLVGRKPTGGKVELNLVRRLAPDRWTALSANLKPGVEVLFPGGIRASVESLDPEGEWILRFSVGEVELLMLRHGHAPLPPYIQKRRKRLPPAAVEDRDRYQTVYAREEGSVAAPTAGLHFTPELLEALRRQGVRVAEVVLHVGRGTFRPVTARDIRAHRMLPERFYIPDGTAAALREARRDGGRVIAVGTSSVRTLETIARRGGGANGAHSPIEETELFILPGHRFLSVDALITNFHQPASTPLLLTSSFAGRERLLEAYHAAIAREYRLFSYGDSMLIV
ncbi:MAG: tRNA preQ1(34) S-adenosylmethionine ribosyltransferase-isomerase QueA [Elusimicrobiota bacterium]